MQRIASKHRIRRSPGELDDRDPSPIHLPLPVGSIPIVGPLVSPLVGNGNGGGTQPPPANPPPAPVSTSGNGNGGGNGNGNSGGNGNGHGGGNGNGNGGGASPFPIPTPTRDAGPTPPNSAPGAQPSASGAKNPSTGGGISGPSSQQGGGNFLGTGGGQTAPVNAASEPSSVTSTPGESGFVSPAQSSLGAPSDTVGAASPTISTVAAISSGKQLSGGAVAGITITCLFFLIALTILVIRRRSISRRLELRKQWWFSRNVSGQSFISRSTRNPAGSNGEAPASRLSARSSFATNFDHGLVLRIDSPSGFSLGHIPDFPPTAEVRERNSTLISTGGAVARRESMNSMLSNGSYPDAQYLTASLGQNNLEPSTPMSVRPFSPSESFAFPKPPAPPSSTADSFFLGGSPVPVSPQSSATTPVHLSTLSPAFMPDLLPTSTLASPNPQIPAPSVTPSPFVAKPNPSTNPFVDPPKTEPSNVEVIRRPFTPSLDDEMPVVPGDRVRIIRVFDDGWAYVEKLIDTGGDRYKRGLIPIDCFRDVDQALQSFFAEKRVSYGLQPAQGTAV